MEATRPRTTVAPTLTPRQVLVITHTARLGGAELALLRLCTAIDPKLFQISIICFENGDLVARLRAMGVEVRVIPSIGDWNNRSRHATRRVQGLSGMALGSLVQAIRTGSHIRNLRPEIVQSWTLKTHVVTTLAWPVYRRPLVWFLHDRMTVEYLGPLNRRLIQVLSRAPRAILANSRATAQTIPRSCVVAYPGLTSEQFLPPSTSRRTIAFPELLLIGRISPTKGQREAILAMKRIVVDYPDAQLRIVGAPLFGEEAYENECHELVSMLGLDSAITFVGQSEDPRGEFDRASVLIHASSTPEPFGQVIAEAMARKLPVVATDAGGVPELLRHDGQQLGLMVAPGDHKALADAVVEVLANPARAAARAERAYAVASAMFTIEHTARVVENTWESVGAHPD